MKKGWQLSALLVGVCTTLPSYALNWADLWWRADQQGQQLLQQDQPSEAAKTFSEPHWQGFAHYRAGEYQAAVNAFAKSDDALAHYNRGNALAQLGQYQEAIKAYDQALAADSDYTDAQYNKQILEKQLQQNPPPPQSDQQQDQNQDDQQPGEQKQDKPDDKNQDKDQDKQKDKQDQPQDQPDDEPQQNGTEGDEDQDQQPSNPEPQQDPSAQAQNVPQQLSPDKQSQGFAKQTQSNPDMSPENVIESVQDDPGGLLRQKFLRDYLRTQQQER